MTVTTQVFAPFNNTFNYAGLGRYDLMKPQFYDPYFLLTIADVVSWEPTRVLLAAPSASRYIEFTGSDFDFSPGPDPNVIAGTITGIKIWTNDAPPVLLGASDYSAHPISAVQFAAAVNTLNDLADPSALDALLRTAPHVANGATGYDILAGGALSDTMNGNGGNDILIGYGSADTLNGGTGDDWLFGGDGNDTLYGGSDIDNLVGDQGDDSLDGGIGNDILSGGIGNDVLDGRSGADTMTGGEGHDTYYWDHALDQIIELAGGGTDQIRSFVSLDMNASAGLQQVERGYTYGVANITIFGNSLQNVLGGNGGNNRLEGRGGIDLIDGGAGDDFIIGGADRDTMTGGAGRDGFRLYTIAETGNAAGARDVITDFASSTATGSTLTSDYIDLGLIDANTTNASHTFAFIGTDVAFTGAGQLRARTEGANTIVEGNVNADLGSDFQIQLTGLKTLVAADFIL